MQLINITIIAIELFGAAFLLIGLAAHLQYHWRNPDAIETIKLRQQAIELHRFDCKLDAIPAIAPAVEQAVVELLEIADSIKAIENVLADLATAIEAVEAEAAASEVPEANSVIQLPQPAAVSDVEAAAAIEAVQPAPVNPIVLPHHHQGQEQPDYQGMTRDQLRQFARDRQIKGYGRLTKPALIAALAA